MPVTRHNPAAFPGIAATAIQEFAPLRLSPVATSPERGVQPVASNNLQIDGFSHLAASYGRPVAMHELDEIVEARAAASLGRGVEVMVGTANASIIGLVPAVAASGVVRWSAGKSITPAADGEVFSLYVNPRQISGLA